MISITTERHWPIHIKVSFGTIPFTLDIRCYSKEELECVKKAWEDFTLSDLEKLRKTIQDIIP